MKKTSIVALVVSLIAVVIAIAGFHSSPATLGQSGTRFPNGITVGSPALQGSQLTALKFGSCTILSGATTIAATSTAQVDCQGGAAVQTALTNIFASDQNVFVALASTTSYTTQGGLILQSAAASTTDGFITLKIFNASGGTFTWASTASSSVRYFVIK